MKITDCVIRTRTIVAGVVFCILFAVLFSILSRPVKASAQGNAPVTLEAGVNKADDTFTGKTLTVPEGDVTLDLNGRDLTVLSVSGEGTQFTLTGKGSLTVSDFLRLSDSTVILDPDSSATVTVNGGVYCRNSELVFRDGDFFCDGKYVHADTIRVEGGSITINAAKDGLRADGAFVMTGGTVDSTGGTHGLHLEGTAELTGGTLKIAGRDGAWHASHEDQIPAELLDLAAADTLVLGTRTTVNANANAASSASTQTETTANAASSASSQTQTPANASANAASSASTQTQTTANANASVATSANAATSASTATGADTATQSVSGASATAAEADTASSIAAEADTASSIAADIASTFDKEAFALPVSASGSDSSGSSSASAGNVKSVQVPAMGDNGMLFYGFALLALAISGFAVISGKGYYHEADQKRRP
ncbi:MAG: hypothetical protein IJQ21_09455 [Lachnospiraceae bacterium]|nr:hypothetical protein [Lachnospiraceae bacterium]